METNRYSILEIICLWLNMICSPQKLSWPPIQWFNYQQEKYRYNQNIKSRPPANMFLTTKNKHFYHQNNIRKWSTIEIFWPSEKLSLISRKIFIPSSESTEKVGSHKEKRSGRGQYLLNFVELIVKAL